MENFVSIVLITTFVFLAVHVLHSLLTGMWTLLSSVDPELRPTEVPTFKLATDAEHLLIIFYCACRVKYIDSNNCIPFHCLLYWRSAFVSAVLLVIR